MADNIDPIEYVEKIAKAWREDDELAVEKIEEVHGEREIKLKELEAVFAYAMQVLSTAYAGLDAIYERRFEMIMKTFVEKEVITQHELDEILKEDQDLQEAIEGTDKEGDED